MPGPALGGGWRQRCDAHWFVEGQAADRLLCHRVVSAGRGKQGAQGAQKRGFPHQGTLCSEPVINGEEEVVRQRPGLWSEESMALVRVEDGV